MRDTELHELRDESLSNNPRHGVTGLLLYVNRVFMQVIEGPHAEIGQLFDNIQIDQRNQSVVEMFDRSVDERAFVGWSMGFHSPAAADEITEKGFHNLRSRNDFSTIENYDPAVFSLMKELYLANAGRGF
jgi:hypothetical protein